MMTESMSTTAALAASESPRTAKFTNTLASEWLKLAALRSTAIMLGLGLILSIGTTALATFAIAATQDEWPADLDRNVFWLVGNIFSLIIFSVFGVLAATREYSSGMIRLTLAATPRRGRVFLAKLLIVTLVTLAAGMAATFGMYFASQAVLAAYDLPTLSLADADTRRTVLGMGAVMPFFPVFGLALGLLFRSAAGAITAVLGLLWLPVIFGEVLPMWWRENIVSLLPGTAVDSFTLSHIVVSPAYTSPAVGVAIATAWLAAILAAAYLTFARRDA